MRTQVLLSVETEETQLGSLGDQVSSYLYYSGYAEPSTTKATQNTPVVRTWVTTIGTSHAESWSMSQYESVSDESLWVMYKRWDVHPHIPNRQSTVPPVRQCLHTWSQGSWYDVRPALLLLPYLAPGAMLRMRLLVAQAAPGRCHGDWQSACLLRTDACKELMTPGKEGCQGLSVQESGTALHGPEVELDDRFNKITWVDVPATIQQCWCPLWCLLAYLSSSICISNLRNFLWPFSKKFATINW